MKASTTIEVDRSIDEVFEFVSTVENMDQWVTGVSEPRRTSDGAFGVGSTLTSKYSYSGQTHDIDYEVTAYTPPTRFDLVAEKGPFPFTGSTELSEIDSETTLVRNTIDAGADSTATKIIFTIGGPFVRWMMRRQLHGELEALREILEGE